ncbi:MAG: Mur ligase domain-containing protein [Deltaproteobacteria bacterium]|jgi:UDP-N-acetylmuramate: L-alanyl-gamma-D-glutamyl-meso-diaminopimelate ligase|nr:Mur ligase domain-containing protein [Deltaproteobacteria bacterium]
MELDPRLNGRPAPTDPAYGRFHLLGVGGVAMTALAGLLAGQGYVVSGSDAGIYPPMSDILRDLKIQVTEGYDQGTLPTETTVVVGNVVTRKFPVLKDLVERGQPYLSLPQTLGELFLGQKKNIVVAGCHGKTTITNLLARLLESAGLRPGYLIGGQSLDLAQSYAAGAGEWFVIEGDEYDSAFFQKVPKFIFYQPNLVILTGVEYDHGDIYPDLASVIEAYGQLMSLLPAEGLLLANGDDPLCRQLAKRARSPAQFYGWGENNDWRLTDYQPGPEFAFKLAGPGANLSCAWSRPGAHNALNAAVALIAALHVGADPAILLATLKTIRGVKRRQELLGQWGGIRLIDDFAHHPTAVAKTIAALKDTAPGRLLVAFEPRSNTTRRAVFQDSYAQALAGAEAVFLAAVNQPDKAPPADRLDPEALVNSLLAQGVKAQYLPDPQELLLAIARETRAGDTVALMSNGDFGGLAGQLARKLAEMAKEPNDFFAPEPNKKH